MPQASPRASNSEAKPARARIGPSWSWIRARGARGAEHPGVRNCAPEGIPQKSLLRVLIPRELLLGTPLLSTGVELSLVWPSLRGVCCWELLALEWEGEISGKFWIKFPMETRRFSVALVVRRFSVSAQSHGCSLDA